MKAEEIEALRAAQDGVGPMPEREHQRAIRWWLAEIALQLARNNEIMADAVEVAKELNV